MSVSSTSESMLSRSSRCTIERRMESFETKARCPRCFLARTCCICAPVKELWAPVKAKLTTRIAIFYHYKEFGRASNTAKLCSIGLDDTYQCDAFIYGNEEDEARLNKLLTESEHSCVLFANSKSIPIANLQAEWSDSLSGDGDDESSSNSSRNSRIVCLLDGTWGQVSAMEKVISPEVPRTHVDLQVSRPSEFLNRKQSENQARISTIEALSLALEQLGEHPEIADVIRKSLQLGVDALLKQGGRAEAFDNIVVPKFDGVADGDTRGPYTAPKVVKPDVCPACLTKPKNGFRNCGIRRPYNVEKDEPGSASHRVWRCNTCLAFHNVDVEVNGPPTEA